MSINTLLQLLAVSVVMRNCKRVLQMGRDMDVVMATNTIFSNLKEETIAIETPTRQIALPDFNDWARGIVFDGLPNDSTNNANLESTTEISVPSSEGEAVQG